MGKVKSLWEDKMQEQFEYYELTIEEMRKVLQQGVDLIQSDKAGIKWKRGCHEYIKAAKLLLKE